ncbi:minor tail protein [Gordonia phage Huffy]|uniref:Minor tail protein n=1 Tax=Gordonia phage TZGordon TaxID=2744004 RepID=A0A6N0A7G2_9CAUD|nr:minor tail protein [Gordonia phage TZGordon]AQY55631.1 minor tail protein [Gordonia phage Huffy]AQY55713.1 minor tail protein [Gordonia phage DinoDaryn]QKO02950.1 minor tail protein [Gordonia phage TZGordon]
MATIIRFRRNTAAEAAASNPVLRAGEPGFAVDTNTLKVGDGVRAWNDLPDVGDDVGGLVVVWGDLDQDVRDRISARLTRDQADALYATVARVSAIESDVSALSDAVDQLDAGKVDRTNLTVRLYGTDGAGNQQFLVWGQSAATPNTIPRRTNTGAIFTADGTDPAHAVNRGQLDAGLAGKANASDLAGKADLVNGVVPTSQINGVTIGKTYPAASLAEMLALDANPGAVALRSDVDAVYMLMRTPASDPGSWFDLSSSAAGGVVSVNGQTATVILGKGDIGLGNVDNTADADKPISGPVAQALSGKVGTGDARLTNERVPVDGSVEWDKLGPTLQSDFAGVDAAARSAVQNKGGASGLRVGSLPATGEAGVLYAVV